MTLISADVLYNTEHTKFKWASLFQILLYPFQARSHSGEKRLIPSSCPTVRLYVCPWISATHTGRISVKLDTGDFYENLSRKYKSC